MERDYRDLVFLGIPLPTIGENSEESAITGTFSLDAIKAKAAHAIAQIQAQSWPEVMQEPINTHVKQMEDALKDLDKPDKKDSMQSRFTGAFAKVLNLIEEGIEQLDPSQTDQTLEGFLLRQHSDHYQEVLQYARSVSELCTSKTDPAVKLHHMVDIAHSSPSPDRRALALRSIALQMTYDWVYQNEPLSSQWEIGLDCIRDLTASERIIIEGMCAQYQKALQTPKGKKALMSSATTLVEESANNQVWIRNRILYLQGKSPKPRDYSLGAMFEYLAFLIDKFFRPSREHKAIIFSNAMRESRVSTAQWIRSEQPSAQPQMSQPMQKNKGNP